MADQIADGMATQAAAPSPSRIGSAAASRGRWYVLLMISAMYLITYLDRVNISTAAPLISKEYGFDKITMGFTSASGVGFIDPEKGGPRVRLGTRPAMK